jgi:hypothetical protein
MDAMTLNINAYHNGDVAPRTMPIATPPKDTCANPSPISARFLTKRNVPRKPATIVTIIEAINARCKPGMTPLKKDGKYFPGIAGAMNSKNGAQISNRIKPIPNIFPPLYEF